MTYRSTKALVARRSARLTTDKLRKLRKDAQAVCRMLELGDTRLMASDGDCGGQLPDLSPDEWGVVYRACKRISEAFDRAIDAALATHKEN